MPLGSLKAKEITRRIVAASKADILVFNAPIERERDRRMISFRGLHLSGADLRRPDTFATAS